MRLRVELDPQVAEFVRSLAPGPRPYLRQSLDSLEYGAGGIQRPERACAQAFRNAGVVAEYRK
jgi:hypothetical protein